MLGWAITHDRPRLPNTVLPPSLTYTRDGVNYTLHFNDGRLATIDANGSQFDVIEAQAFNTTGYYTLNLDDARMLQDLARNHQNLYMIFVINDSFNIMYLPPQRVLGIDGIELIRFTLRHTMVSSGEIRMGRMPAFLAGDGIAHDPV